MSVDLSREELLEVLSQLVTRSVDSVVLTVVLSDGLTKQAASFARVRGLDPTEMGALYSLVVDATSGQVVRTAKSLGSPDAAGAMLESFKARLGKFADAPVRHGSIAARAVPKLSDRLPDTDH